MKKLREFLLPLAVSSLLFLHFSVSPLQAEVALTDEEAKEMMNEMKESEKELENVKKELAELKATSEEQSQSYREQLTEAEKKNSAAWTVTGISGGASIGLLIALLLVILL